MYRMNSQEASKMPLAMRYAQNFWALRHAQGSKGVQLPPEAQNAAMAQESAFLAILGFANVTALIS